MSEPRPAKQMGQLLDDLDGALKSPSVGADLTDRGINVSLALCIAAGLRAYLDGDKRQAAEDLATAAEEIAARLAVGTADEQNRP